MAIISDAGTPVFADPGQHLLELLYQMDIPVSPLPGPGSLMAALSLCDFPIDRFFFAGFPPQKTHHWVKFSGRIYVNETIPVILMDTPYRLTKLLTEVEKIFGKEPGHSPGVRFDLEKRSIFIAAIGEGSFRKSPVKNGNSS